MFFIDVEVRSKNYYFLGKEPVAKISLLCFMHSPVGYGHGIDSSSFASEQLLGIGMSGDSPLIGFISFPILASPLTICPVPLVKLCHLPM